jgi:asparagine synthase (glutamine-hydrolysing)
LTTNIKNVITIEDFLSEMVKGFPYQDDFYRLMYLNFKYDLPDDFLVKVDRMSMSNSLETRAPFLDHRLIEFMVKVDKNIKMQGWERKSVLRNTIGKQLPDQLLKSPKKGFNVPVRDWFKEDHNSNILDLGNVKSICDSLTIGQIIDWNTKGIMDSGNFLWTMIMLNKFV